MANTYKALSTVTVGAGGSSSIAFSNIPQTYTDLVLQISLRSNRATEVYDTGYIRFNSDSGANYSKSMRLYGNGASAVSDNPNLTSAGLFEMPTASGATASTFGNISIYIPNYVSNTNYKSYSNDGVSENNGTTSYQSLIAGVWNNTSPITSITLTPFAGSQFVQYSTATLYGVFNADVSSAPATPTIGTATGGNTQASITFTPVSNAASYTMTSTPSSITATGTTSPIVVTGLSNGTAYTFKVKSNNPFGSSAESAASNSATPTDPAAFESIATITTNGSTSTATFSSIPSTYAHLQLRCQVKNTSGGTSGFTVVQVNNDTASNYSYHRLSYNPVSGAFANSSATSTGSLQDFEIGGNADTTNLFSSAVIDFYDYAKNKNKTIRALWGAASAATISSDYAVNLGSLGWRNTNAINTISITAGNGNWAANCTFALYGIKE